MKEPVIEGQRSWNIENDSVSAAITQLGGHLAPVVFDRSRKAIQPFSVAPWAEEKVTGQPNILKVLRGDFFCMPFGGNDEPWQEEQHPVHGETANRKWSFHDYREDENETILHLRMRTKVRKGRVDKILRLHQGHNAVYQRHVLTDYSGKINIGHHATLKFPDIEGSGLISTSKLVHCQNYINPTEDPAMGGYSTLKPGARFKRLNKVPLLDGSTTDLSRYPSRKGFEDIAILINDPNAKLAWTAVSFPDEGYVWFALKDPKVLASTLLWMSNGGRHYAPWNGRHHSVMGLEE